MTDTAPDAATLNPPEITALRPRPEVIDFLTTRRSRPARTLTTPVPQEAELAPLLTAALRVPDHGKLEPWRLIVLERAALDRLADLAGQCATELGLAEDQARKGIAQFADSPLCIAVVSVPRSTEKVPAWEQDLSCGALCMQICNVLQAASWGACWLTGWPAFSHRFTGEGLGLEAGERIAGFIHTGTETALPPERPRPDPGTVIQWQKA